jgi:hypothetical protein
MRPICDSLFTELTISIRKIVFPHQGVLAEGCGERFVILVHIPLGYAGSGADFECSVRSPTQPTPTRIFGLFGDLLEIPVNGFPIVSAGDANGFEQVVLGTEMQCRSLKTVRRVCLRLTGDKAVRNDPGPEILCRPVVAFVVAENYTNSYNELGSIA